MDKGKNDRSNVKTIFLTALITAVVTLLVTDGGIFLGSLMRLPRDVSEFETEFSEFKKEFNSLNIGERLTKIETEINGIDTRLANVEAKVFPLTASIEEPSIKIQLGEQYAMAVFEENISYKMKNYLTAPDWGSEETIATGESGTYTAKELAGKKLLIPYEANGQEMYFYGQFDDKNQWNGPCVVNAYKDGKLIFIMDAVYESGVLSSYKQVMPSLEGDTWILSERISNGDVNSGKTWEYGLNQDYESDFNFETVVDEDIIDVDTFREWIDGSLVEFYCGNTSEGKYNDDSGEAYLVKYAEDNTVRTLYQGKFKDGKFEDSTGNAWYITKEKDTPYMYYKGHYRAGKPTHNKGYIFEHNIGLERIQEIIRGKNFECELKWYEETETKF